MPRRESPNPYNVPGVLRLFLLLIFSMTIIAQPDSNIFTIDDGGTGISNLYTSPIFGSSAQQDSIDPSIPRWATQSCDSCPSPRPSSQSVYDSTYTAVYIPAGNPHTYNVSFRFNGTQIKVYLIISNQAPTSCDFMLDGSSVPFNANTTDDYQYQKLAYSSTMLDLRMHELTIRAAGLPDTANYLNFDYAGFTHPSSKTTRAADDLGPPSGNATTSSALPTSSSSATDQHETIKAIAGGVVGGFIAIIVLICAASFYRNRRLRELEETAHPFIPSNHHRTPSWQQRTHAPAPAGITPFTLQSPVSADPPPRQPPTTIRFGHPDSHTNHAEYQNRVRQQHEPTRRPETVTAQMRPLKSSYIQDQQRQRNQHRQVQHVDFEGNHDPDPPVIRIVPGGSSDPVLRRDPGGAPMPSGGEPMVTPMMLADVQQRPAVLDRVQYLRAQQNSPYTQGLTDSPPPGYTDVINSHHGRFNR